MRSPRRSAGRPRCPPDQILLVNLSGRGDKDLETVVQALENRRPLEEQRPLQEAEG